MPSLAYCVPTLPILITPRLSLFLWCHGLIADLDHHQVSLAVFIHTQRNWIKVSIGCYTVRSSYFSTQKTVFSYWILFCFWLLFSKQSHHIILGLFFANHLVFERVSTLQNYSVTCAATYPPCDLNYLDTLIISYAVCISGQHPTGSTNTNLL